MVRYLVTGGAGFVGSHLVLALLARGDDVVVLDDLSTGHRAAVPAGARLVVGDLANDRIVDALLADGPWDAVFHFAALSLVGESMRAPMRYLRDNAGNGIRLIDACVRHGVSRFVLSSTANIFGSATTPTLAEDAPIEPASAYGESKRMIERALLWAERVHGLRGASLRYFNAAGADPAGRLGEDHRPETHLIPLAIDAALGRGPELTLFGEDYLTPDGTCIRDYVHVHDLADAHLRVLTRLEGGGVCYNLGNGAGHSVREVLAAVGDVLGRAVPVRVGPRRAGDPARLVACSDLIRAQTGWRPAFGDLHRIVEHASAWRIAHPDGYGPR